jgi:putative transposase
VNPSNRRWSVPAKLERLKLGFSAPSSPGWEERDLLPVFWIAESWKVPVLKRGPETERAMKKSKFTEAQIAFILKQAEEGVPVAEVCRKAGISDATFYGWRKKYAGLMPSEMKRLRQLEEENGKLKKLVADLSLDKAMLQDVLSRKL